MKKAGLKHSLLVSLAWVADGLSISCQHSQHLKNLKLQDL